MPFKFKNLEAVLKSFSNSKHVRNHIVNMIFPNKSCNISSKYLNYSTCTIRFNYWAEAKPGILSKDL